MKNHPQECKQEAVTWFHDSAGERKKQIFICSATHTYNCPSCAKTFDLSAYNAEKAKYPYCGAPCPL